MKSSIEEERKEVKKHLSLYMIALGVFIILVPFAYPILATCLIKIGVFESLSELNNLINLFSNKYMFTVIIILLILVIFEFGNGKILHDILSKLRLKYQKGDSSLELSSNFEDKKEKFIVNNEVSEELRSTKKELKEKLNLTDNKMKSNVKDKEKNILKEKNIELETNIRNIRFFSAYTVLNVCSKKLLSNIYKNSKINKEEFNYKLVKHYKNKLSKRIPKNKIDEYSQNKVQEILFDLIYLDIIEYSEDDKYLLLTQNGNEFVEKYLKGDEDYGKFN